MKTLGKWTAMTEVPAAAELYTQKQLKWQMLGDGSTGKMLGMQAPELSLAPRAHVKARSRDMHLKFQSWGGRVRKGPGTHWPLKRFSETISEDNMGKRQGRTLQCGPSRLYKVHSYIDKHIYTHIHQIKNLSEICNVPPTLPQ